METYGKRKKLTSVAIDQKIKALNAIKNGISKAVIAKQLDVCVDTVSSWMKNENSLREWQDENDGDISKEKKRLTKPNYDLVDKAAWMWFQERRRAGCPVKGMDIKAQALRYAKMIDSKTEFNGSQGWLDKWKKRHGIGKAVMSGEKQAANHAAACKNKELLTEMIKNEKLTADQMFHCDESRLIFRDIPRRKFGAHRRRNISGFKLHKDYVTIMACSNALGTLKLPLVLVGKSMKPRAIKNVSNIPVSYQSQKNAWMTGPLLEKWFVDEFIPKVETFLKSRNLPLKAVLFINNSAVDPQTLQKGEIRVEFLPSNFSSAGQPDVDGSYCLQNLKMNYRLHVMSFLLDHLKNGLSIVESLKKITIKDVIFWASEAWNAVSPTTIIKSSKQLWPKLETIIGVKMSNTDQINLWDDDVVRSFSEALQKHDFPEANVETVNEWIKSTSILQEDLLSDEEILQSVRDDENKNEQDENKDEKDNTNNQVPNFELLNNSVECLISYCETNPNFAKKYIEVLKNIRKDLNTEMLRAK